MQSLTVTLPTRASDSEQETASCTGDAAGAQDARDSEPVLLAPHTVVGRYIVLEHLGSGGMGVVYKAYDPDLNRQIALKLVRVEPSRSKDPAVARGRLLREAQGLAQLSHPNVVAVYDVGLYEDGVFLAIELVSGPTLRAWLKTNPSDREKLRVFLAAGEGLAAAHRAGLVHRDFKPDNVILGDDGRPRVLDFGLVRAVGDGLRDPEMPSDDGAASLGSNTSLGSNASLGANASLGSTASLGPGTDSILDASLSESSSELNAPLTRVGAVLGTPRYMSPEQLLGQPAGAASDQFSFCVALYGALYGEPPFRITTMQRLRSDVCKGKVQPPPTGVRVAPVVRRALLRGLAPDADKRYPSMRELLDELARDPARAWRHRLATAAVVLSVGFGAWSALAGHDESGVALCRGAADELASTWNAKRQAAVKQGFVASGVGYAGDTFERVATVIDDYGKRWVAMRTHACEATHIQGVQSDAALDLRMGCLDRRLRSLEALITVLEDNPDRQVVTKAVEASLGLGEIDLCADVEALEKQEPLPERREDRRTLAVLRGGLDEVNQLNAFGKYKNAQALLDTLAPQVESLGFPPLDAELAYYSALTLDSLGKYTEAESALKSAIEIALKWGMNELVAKAEAEATYVVGYRLQRHTEALVYALHARGITRGRGDELEAKSLAKQAALYLDQRQYAEAEDLYQQTLALRKKALGPEHPAVATLLNNLAIVYRYQKKYSKVEDLYKQSLAIKEKTLGPKHPAVAKSLHNLAAFYFQQQRFADAETLFENALAIYEAAYGADHPNVAFPLLGLAETSAKVGKVENVLPLIERARTIRQHADVAPILRADIDFYLAQFLWANGDDRTRSKSLARSALALYESAGQMADQERLAVEKWISEHR